MADADYNTINYDAIGGAEDVIGNGGLLSIRSGGAINVEAGGLLKFAGVDAAAALALAVAGVAAGYKIARGEVTLDGANPTPAVTGLATVVAAIAVFKRSTAPALDPLMLTVDYGGGVTAGVLNIHAWKPTAANDTTMIASTNNTAVVSWLAIGT